VSMIVKNNRYRWSQYLCCQHLDFFLSSAGASSR